MRGIDNAFLPWSPVTDDDKSAAAATTRIPEGWRLRRGVWNLLVRFKFHEAKALFVPKPSDQPPLTAVPFSQGFPDVPIAGLFVADQVPDDEYEARVMLFVRFQSWLNRVFPPRVAGLPAIDADPRKALDAAYPARRRAYRSPLRPPEYDDLDLGGVAVASPVRVLWQRHRGRDLRVGPDRSQPLRVPRRAPRTGRPRGVRARRARPSAPRRDHRQRSGRRPPGRPRLARGAAAGHVRARNPRHARTALQLDPPRLRRAAGARDPQPSATNPPDPTAAPTSRHATQFSNQIVTLPQMEPGGDFESVFSYTHRGMCELFEATIGRFRPSGTWSPTSMPPGEGSPGSRSTSRARQPARAHARRYAHHTERYLALYFHDDAALAADEAYAAWLHDLRGFVPQGVDDLAGCPVTVGGAAALLSTLIYMGSVDHEIVDSGVWDYQLWSDVQPVRVYRNGQRMPLDVYQRLVNSNFILNVDRTRLMSDFSYLANDQRGADAFLRFRRDLVELQETMDRAPAACWRVEPRQLKANINY